jgi:hypothetical protein
LPRNYKTGREDTGKFLLLRSVDVEPVEVQNHEEPYVEPWDGT